MPTIIYPAGTPTLLIGGVAPLGGARTLTLPTSAWSQIISVKVKLATSATVGNRQLTLSFLDPTAAQLGTVVASAVQTATTSINYTFGGGIATTSATLTQTISIPTGMCIPPLGAILIQDLNAVDGTDSVTQFNVVYGILA